METPDIVLEAVDIHKSFGGVPALDGCGIALPRGSVTGLIGPNGSGKSTLIEIISGLLAPDRGTVRLAGANITSWAPYRRSASSWA